MTRSLFAVVLFLGLTGCGASEEEASEPPPPASQPTEVTETTAETDEPSDDWEPPPYDYERLAPAERDRVCAQSGEPASDFECTEDTDCRICHDGSDCGVPVNLAELRRRGASCQQEDAAECEYAAVRCCEGRCKVVGH